MPAEDYKPVTSGTLKLKGIQDSKISKKKKRPKPSQHSTSNQDSASIPQEAGDELSTAKQELETSSGLEKQESERDAGDIKREEMSLHGRAKTEAEIRHEERRRKRVWFIIVSGSLLVALNRVIAR